MSYEPQVNATHYEGHNYNSKGRFISYWHQIHEIQKRAPESILEIGVGNGFLSRYLRHEGLNVHTLDHDPDLEPDTVGSVLELPFEDDHFDMAVAFQVLEHLPWETFEVALSELRRVSKRWVIVSLPDVTRFARVDMHLGTSRLSAHSIKDIPDPIPQVHVFAGHHYWEIGKQDFPVQRILDTVVASGLTVEEHYRVYEMPYHRFICCACG